MRKNIRTPGDDARVVVLVSTRRKSRSTTPPKRSKKARLSSRRSVPRRPRYSTERPTEWHRRLQATHGVHAKPIWRPLQSLFLASFDTIPAFSAALHFLLLTCLSRDGQTQRASQRDPGASADLRHRQQWPSLLRESGYRQH